MSDTAVVEFLNKIAGDESLRSTAKRAFRDRGAEGIVELGAKQGKIFTSQELDAVISPKRIKTGMAESAISIGWG
ncbi:MAG: hypothetical protein ACRDRS_12550 [Pseudonocardiaceae bacterium]